MAYVYALGAVKPWVKDAANEIGNRFGVATIYGVGSRETANSDHPKGLALDFMVAGDSAKGDAIASFLQANYDPYNVQYIIWKQQIWNVARASEGWRAMPDRGSPTANHYDHVHVSFKAFARIGGSQFVGDDPGKSGISIPNPLDGIKATVDGIKGSIDAINKVGQFVSNGHNWLRVGMFTAGGLLLLLALIMFVATAQGKPATVAKAAKTVTNLKPKGVKNG